MSRAWQAINTATEASLTGSFAVYQTLSWTPGEAGDYAIVAYSDIASEDLTDKVYIKLEWEYNTEGYTEVSQKIVEQSHATPYKPYMLICRIQVSEGNKNKQINVRIQAMADTGAQGLIKNRRIMAIPLGTADTDYWYDEDLTGSTFGTTETELLSIVTTGLDAGDYLVISDVDCTPSDNANRSGQIAWKRGTGYLHGYWTFGTDAAPLLEVEDTTEFEKWPFFGVLTLPLSASPLKMIGRTEAGTATWNDARMFLIKLSSISTEWEKASSLGWSSGTSGTKNSITSFSQTETGKYLIGQCSLLDRVTAVWIQEELEIESTRRDGHYQDRTGDGSDILPISKFWIEDYVGTGSRNYYQKWAAEYSEARIGFAYLFVIQCEPHTVGGVTHEGAATLSGVGTLSGIGALILAAKATLSGVGALSALGGLLHTAQATLSGVGSLAAIAQVVIIRYGSATLSGVGTLVAKGYSILGGKATLSGIGTLSAIATKVGTLYGVATLSGVGTVAAKSVANWAGKGVLAGVGTLSAIGRVIVGGVVFRRGWWSK